MPAATMSAMDTASVTLPGLAPPAAPHAARGRSARLASDLLPWLDVAWLLLAATLATRWLAAAGAVPTPMAPALWFAAALAPFVLYDAGFGAQALRRGTANALLSHALRLAGFVLLALGLGWVSGALAGTPAAGLAIWLFVALLGTTLTRAATAGTLHRLQRQGRLAEVVAIVGSGPVAEQLLHRLRRERADDIELVGCYDDGADGARAAGVGSIEQLLALGATRHIDWLVLAPPPQAAAAWAATVQRLQAMQVPMGLCPQHMGSARPPRHATFVGDRVAVGLLAERPIDRWDAVAKGAEDLLLGGLLTLLLLPLLALIALAIRLDSPGPVIFRQRRHALDNREFDIFKFRTMRAAAATEGEPLHQTTRGDARITRIGRFLRASSLDELPQLFNVLRGQMSLVGPRPHATGMRTANLLGAEIIADYAHRHRVKPGITGWAQVNGWRGNTAIEKRIEYDIFYIENWSFSFDLKILWLTLRHGFIHKHAY